MIDTPRYLCIVRLSAWYDLLATGAFMTPWSMQWLFSQLAQLSTGLGLGELTPLVDPVHMLLANLLGSVVVIWALLRLRHTRAVHGLYDAGARGLFALWQGVAVMQGASPLVLGFMGMEVVFGMVQVWPVLLRCGSRPPQTA